MLLPNTVCFSLAWTTFRVTSSLLLQKEGCPSQDQLLSLFSPPTSPPCTVPQETHRQQKLKPVLVTPTLTFWPLKATENISSFFPLTFPKSTEHKIECYLMF